MVTMVTQSWVRGATVAPACAPMGRAVDGSFLTAATFWPTSWCVCAAPATKVHTRAPKTHTVHKFVSCRCDTSHFTSSCLHKHIPSNYPESLSVLPVSGAVQVPGATSALPATSATRWCPAAAACPASATTTSTCTTRARVTPGRAPASSACTTPRATPVSTANVVTMAAAPVRAAGVSGAFCFANLDSGY